ncbi:MAG: glycoside hydrolase family 28 protein [Planctomycetota bacterium]|jgi:polygalacturonase
MSDYLVADFGAAGDGAALDTEAIQKAIDACHREGGGRVVLTPGTYRSGTLFLKSHVELHLQGGAVLKGTGEREAYNPDDIFPENEVFTEEDTTGAHLIIAYRAENIAITGQGTIDGNSSAFFLPLPEEEVTHDYRYKHRNFPIGEWRPSQMIFFCRCRNAVVKDVSMLNAPYWTFFLLGCEDIRIRGLLIENAPQTQNGDGIDIDCCRNVTVSDCIIRSGDDAITLRGNIRPLGEEMPCENIVVTNCVLQSPCNAIRVGVGDGLIRDCFLSNIIIKASRTGINMVSRYGDAMPRGVQMERIRFSNFRMETVTPLHLYVGPGGEPPVGIRDIDFHGFHVTAEAGSHLGGEPGCPIERVRLTDWDLLVKAGTDNQAFVGNIPEPYRLFGAHGQNGGPALPCPLYLRHARDVALEDVRVRWGEALGKVWQHAVELYGVEDIALRGLRAPSPITGEPQSIVTR